MRDGAVAVRFQGLLREKLRGFLLSLRKVSERKLGERRRVARLAEEHLARLGDRLVELAAVAQSSDVERPCFDRGRVGAHEVREPVGRLAILAAPPPHLAQRDRHFLRVGRELLRRRELLLGARQVPGARQDDAQIEPGLPELRVELHRFTERPDGTRPLPLLRRLHALHHPPHRGRLGRRPLRRDRHDRRRRFGAAARDDARDEAHRGSGPKPAQWAPLFGTSMSAGIGSGPCERTSNPVSFSGGYSSPFNRPSASRIFAVHWL